MLTPQPDFTNDSTIINLQPELEQLRTFSKNLVITNPKGYEIAAERLKSIKGALAQIEEARVRITKPLVEAQRETNAQANAAKAPWLAEENTIKNALIAFSDEQDRIRKEEQRKANEAAERERREIQERAAAAKRKADEEAAAKRRAAEEAAAAGRAAEAAKLAAQAVRIEEKGADKQTQLEDRAAAVVAPIAQQAAPRVAGISVPLVWDFVIDKAELVPIEFRDISETRIRKVVNAMQGNTRIPGVRVFQKKRVSAGMS